MTGKIRTLRVDKGFGFIKDDNGNEFFFHRSAVYGEGLEDLREGPERLLPQGVGFGVGVGVGARLAARSLASTSS